MALRGHPRERNSPRISLRPSTFPAWALSALALAWCSCIKSGGSHPQGAGSAVPTKFLVENDSSLTRTQTVLASVPFARGLVSDLSNVSIKDIATSWRILQRWDDGSVKVAQAQFTTELQPFETTTFEVLRNVAAQTGDFAPHPWVEAARQSFRLEAEVVDDAGVSYSADLQNPPQVLHASFHVRSTFQRVYLRNSDPNRGIQRDFLTARIYVTEFRDMPLMSVDVVLANDYLGADNPNGSTDPNLYPLGAVSLSKALLHVGGVQHRLEDRVRFGVGPPVQDPQEKRDTYTLLANTWIDDGQTIVWKLTLYFEDASAGQEERDRWRAVFAAEETAPLRPLATLKSWQGSGALGINGGPVTGPDLAHEWGDNDVESWRAANHFGTFGSWGETKYTHTTGTPRNGPCSVELGHAIQGENPALLEVLEGKARRQALRTYHMWGLKVGTGKEIYLWDGIPYRKGATRVLSLENLGRKALYANDPYVAWRTGVNWSAADHGWNGYDEEHFSTDLLFDYYTVTGSFWARDELRTLGQCLKGLMRLTHYFTAKVQAARAEGWTMQSFVQCYLATGDEDLKTYALRRIEEIVETNRHKKHASRHLARQWNYPGTRFPNPTAFFMPWQHSAVAYGYLGAARFFGSATAMKIAEDVVMAVDYSSVQNYPNDPKHGFVAYGLRYYVPVIHNGQSVPASFFDKTPGIGPRWGSGGPTGGAHGFLIGALYLVADHTANAAIRQQALFHGAKLLGTVDPSRGKLWLKWTFTVPDGLLTGLGQ